MLHITLLLVAFLTGCGTVGEPLYPALNIPTRVSDLAAVERGEKIDIVFTIPPLTTEGLVLKEIGSVEMRVGPAGSGDFSTAAWAAGAKRIDVPAPTKAGSVRVATPAQEFIGKAVVLAVRVGNAKGRMSDWSNLAVLNIEQPLATPAGLDATGVPEGVRLTWNAPGESAFRIFRKAGEEKEPSVLANAAKPEFVDTSTEYGKTYEYYVQGVHGKTESDLAGPKSFTPKDTFAPGVPAGLVASVGVGAIELTWERNTEADFKEYRVYRSEENGPPLKIAENIEAPSYSDRKVESGKHYTYRVTAVDQVGNESNQSEPAGATAP